MSGFCAAVVIVAHVLGIGFGMTLGYVIGVTRAAADIDDAFDTGHAFGTYRATGDES